MIRDRYPRMASKFLPQVASRLGAKSNVSVKFVIVVSAVVKASVKFGRNVTGASDALQFC